MGKGTGILLKKALQLPENERTKLVDELLTTLDSEQDENVDEAWAKEVEKRALELSKGTVKPVIWDEVKRRTLKKVYSEE